LFVGVGSDRCGFAARRSQHKDGEDHCTEPSGTPAKIKRMSGAHAEVLDPKREREDIKRWYRYRVGTPAPKLPC
jgi:hypothetical protein